MTMKGDNSADDRAVLLDQIMFLVGRFQETRADSPLLGHAESLGWIRGDARERLGLTDSARLERRAERFLDSVMRRVASSRMCVREAGKRPTFLHAAVRGTVSQVLPYACARGYAPHVPLSAAAGAERTLWDETCDEWLEVPREVEGGRFLSLTVSGDSMLPLLHSGDVVLVRLDDEVRRDTVVLARVADDGYVVKRVASIDTREIVLASLNADYEPVRIPAQERRVLGTVVASWCSHAAVHV